MSLSFLSSSMKRCCCGRYGGAYGVSRLSATRTAQRRTLKTRWRLRFSSLIEEVRGKNFRYFWRNAMFSLRSLLPLITWNTSFEANPESSDSPSFGDDEIRNLKTAMRERFEKGHTMNTAVGTVGPDGWHKSGSAKLYYQAAAPTTRPDGTTALTADDNGRRWVRSTDNSEYVYVHPSWTVVTTLNGT